MSETVRPPAVAGTFYAADPRELLRQVEAYLENIAPSEGPSPKAIIAPHAGYIYSGPIAGQAYAHVRPAGIQRVVLLGPAHREPLRGVAVSSAAIWRTPLGDVPIERPEGIPINDIAHREEHSLEVHLPFLQVVLGEFTLIPLVVGNARSSEIAEVLDSLWGGPETLIVISSDLSHYERYESANRMDGAASEAIVKLDPSGLQSANACGYIPIIGLLELAKQKRMRAELIDLRNSGDTAGPRDQVVGYGAYAFYA